jgi:hypothetical protein
MMDDDDDDECGAVDGMRGSGKRNTRKIPAPVQICPPQLKHDPARARTRATAVENQRLAALLRHGQNSPEFKKY